MKNRFLISIVILISLLALNIQPTLAQDVLPEDPTIPLEPIELPEPPPENIEDTFAVSVPPESNNSENLPIPTGRTSGFGTYFEVNDSEYLNVILESSIPVEAMLDSRPRMLIIEVKASSDGGLVNFTLRGLTPSTTYYQYLDERIDSTVISSDESGTYTFSLDLSETHNIRILAEPGTIYIPWDTSVGEWNSETRVYTLTQDVYDLVYVDSDNLILDGNGYTIYPSPDSYPNNGVQVWMKNAVTIKNLTVTGFDVGIFSYQSTTFVDNCTLKSNHYGMEIYNDNGSILTNSEFSNNSQTGVQIWSSSGVTVENNIATNNQGAGIYLYGGADAYIQENVISSNNHGIFFAYVLESMVSGNTITSNRSNGIYMYDSYENTIFGNLISDNTNYGIDSRQSSYTSIQNNEIRGSWSGIMLEVSSAEQNVSGNLITENNGFGIYIADSNNNKLDANQIYSNAYSGVYIRNSQYGTIQSNSIMNNIQHGLLLSNSTNIVITNNSIESNGMMGVYCSANDNQFLQNTLRSNTQYGIGLFSTQGNLVQGNLVSDNQSSGVYLSYSINNILTENQIELSGSQGIYSWHSSDSEFSNNIITRNTNDGLSGWYSDGNEIRENIIENGNRGIFLGNSNSNVVENNQLSNNNQDGISLQNSSGGLYTGNSISENHVGILTNNSVGENISNNEISNNNHGVYLTYSNNVIIEENTVSQNNYNGIYTYRSTQNTIQNNVLDKNLENAILLNNQSNENLVLGNIVTNTFSTEGYASKGVSLYLYNSHSNLVKCNTIANNLVSIYIIYSHNNRIVNNSVFGNRHSVSLTYSSNNTLQENNFAHNLSSDFSFMGSDWNQIYNNNFIENNGIPYVTESNDNIFNYNFWSSWNTPDNNGDGIVDIPYIFNPYDPESRKDDFPLTDQLVWADLQINASQTIVEVGAEITFDASDSTDPDGELTSFIWTMGDGAGNGTVRIGETISHTYVEPGIYTVVLSATDNSCHTTIKTTTVVAYDPSAGFISGLGTIYSPPGAYAPDPALDGTANFAFVSRYQPGAHTPTGKTQFIFKDANFTFYSDSYDWLVVAGAKAMYKGTGTINGSGNYGFMLTAIDEKFTPRTDVDLFRIKIWDKATDTVIYDNQMGADDDADPTTAITSGKIVIHK